MELNDGRRALSVFSFEEEARLFQRLGTRGGWWVRETGVGKLLSVLYGPCREVELVALDPLPQREAGALNGLLCVDRERFVGFFCERGWVIRAADAPSCRLGPWRRPLWGEGAGAGRRTPRRSIHRERRLPPRTAASGEAYRVGKTGRA